MFHAKHQGAGPWTRTMSMAGWNRCTRDQNRNLYNAFEAKAKGKGRGNGAVDRVRCKVDRIEQNCFIATRGGSPELDAAPPIPAEGKTAKTLRGRWPIRDHDELGLSLKNPGRGPGWSGNDETRTESRIAPEQPCFKHDPSSTATDRAV